jgi:hypothetical protein
MAAELISLIKVSNVIFFNFFKPKLSFFQGISQKSKMMDFFKMVEILPKISKASELFF